MHMCSVAEEGIDIPACSLVIRYDWCTTVTAMIQSRGRAREKSSEFVLIVHPEQNDVNELTMLELRVRGL